MLNIAYITRKMSTLVSRPLRRLRSVAPTSNHPPRLLVEIQSSTDLDDPAVVESDLAIMDVGVKFHLQHDIQLQQALLKLIELLGDAD